MSKNGCSNVGIHHVGLYVKDPLVSAHPRSLLKRLGTSDEVARAARFLLSEDSSNITGTELIIDGGVRLN